MGCSGSKDRPSVKSLTAKPDEKLTTKQRIERVLQRLAFGTLLTHGITDWDWSKLRTCYPSKLKDLKNMFPLMSTASIRIPAAHAHANSKGAFRPENDSYRQFGMFINPESASVHGFCAENRDGPGDCGIINPGSRQDFTRGTRPNDYDDVKWQDYADHKALDKNSKNWKSSVARIEDVVYKGSMKRVNKAYQSQLKKSHIRGSAISYFKSEDVLSILERSNFNEVVVSAGVNIKTIPALFASYDQPANLKNAVELRTKLIAAMNEKFSDDKSAQSYLPIICLYWKGTPDSECDETLYL